ncbi:hypothetical protein BG015_002917 [Linnemannia schmuckeri]|uniref:Uncharacterized protein n=1 Tax=Linnemannia schmuckeri TaxID=64567 RepID=A0A9P5RNH8_9FUNG|nr:hypothetical protein BG015_002917 [Linnemannia schmuckeri]
MRSTRHSSIATLAFSVVLALTLFTLAPAMATPVGHLRIDQSLFSAPAGDTADEQQGIQQVKCGTFIGIDFGDLEFSVGFVNPDDNKVELISNDQGQLYTPSFVRITTLENGDNEVIVGQEAYSKPVEERHMLAEEAARKRESESKATWNISMPMPDHLFRFHADVAYGVGYPEYRKVGWVPERMSYFFGSAGDEFGDNSADFLWSEEETTPEIQEDVATAPEDVVSEIQGAAATETEGDAATVTEGGEAATENLRQSAATADKVNERNQAAEVSNHLNRFKQFQETGRLLMRKAKGMAEARLSTNITHVVVAAPRFSVNQFPQPNSTARAAYLAGLKPIILSRSEASVYAYESLINLAEKASARPQIVAVYYLNDLYEGISIYRTHRPEPDRLFQLKPIVEYHFYQTVRRRMSYALTKHLYTKYLLGRFITADKSRWNGTPRPPGPHMPESKKWALSTIYIETGSVERESFAWDASSGDEEVLVSVSEYDSVLFTRQEWWDFERAFLKLHFSRLIERAYEKGNVNQGDRPSQIDHFLVMDESQYRRTTSAIMKEVLNDANELSDPNVEPKLQVAIGAARVAGHLTQNPPIKICT